jgi:hypothetical protein
MAARISATTQEHLEIDDIIEDVVILKDGSACLVLQTTAVNFGLLSEREQDATIFAYAALLNSLSFPIQIVIRSKRTDISNYLEQLSEAEEKQRNLDLKDQIRKYREFVSQTVQKGRVLDKKFYIVIPFSFLELGAGGALKGLAKGGGALPYSKDYILEQAKINLYPKRDQLLKQLARLGLSAKVLTAPELVELYFDVYNPAEVGTQKVYFTQASYFAPIVEPAIEEEEKPVAPPPQPTTVQPTPAQTQATKEQEKALRELQEVVVKAKAGLAQKTAAPPTLDLKETGQIQGGQQQGQKQK